MKVKICGITDSKIAEFVDQCGCDFMGVVFYNKSLRYVEPKNSTLIADSIVKSRKVAVVVEPNMDFLNEIIINFKPDFIQFHGNLNHQYFLKFKNKYPDIGVIIGKNIINKNDLEDLKNFDDIADYFLLDGAKSGSGQSFDWSIIGNFNFTKPWFLAGGLTLDNINEAIKITKASMIDISSGLEKTRFIKDKDLIMALMKKLNKVC